MRVYVVGARAWCGPSTVSMFKDNGWDVIGDEILRSKDYSEIDLVVFTGGADVSPHLYGEENISSSVNEARDQFECDVYYSLPESLPKAGICRGGQFLNVMNGGKLIQDHGHIGDRVPMYGFVSGKFPKAEFKAKVLVCHHQGIVAVDGTGYDVKSLDWISLGEYKEEKVQFDNWPVYTVYFPGTKALCFQPHPEWGDEGTERYFFDLLKTYFGFELNRFQKKAA